MTDPLSRRELLKTTSVLAAGALLGGVARARADEAGAAANRKEGPPAPRKRVLRVAHLTDFHIQPELRAGDGVLACLKHVQSRSDKPDLIMTGGDLVMDAFDQTRDRTQTQWDLFTKVLRDECSLPIEHCLGNHDVWGWNKKNSGCTGDEPEYGKKWACDTLGLPGPYRSFDRAGWHFIVLDSVFPDGDGYKGRLDDAQFEWLTADLARTPKSVPVIVVSHIPILSITVLNDYGNKAEAGGGWKIGAGAMHVDSRKIRNLFAKHGNVRVALSGHIHLLDRVDYNGTTFFCDGAVSGAWWKGRNQDCDEGYALIDLFDDGTVEREYATYGWKAGAQ